MRDLKIEEVIKAVPLKESTKEELLKNYHSYDDNRKTEIIHVCWKGFNQMKVEMERIKYQQFLIEVEEGKRTFAPDFMQQVQDAVWQDIEDLISGKKNEQIELTTIRTQLQQLIDKHS